MLFSKQIALGLHKGLLRNMVQLKTFQILNNKMLFLSSSQK